ncbi:MAG: recombination regulator RecX [Chloroflexi bacterium]|nr:recombination regulator RecX [Chloroflexota bacterium]
MAARITPAERRARHAEVEDPAIVLEAALRFLEARQRSTDEVRRRLTTAGYRSELVDAAIERLTGLGILDDESFAQTWLSSRDRASPRGERALRFELQRKGLAPEVIAEALEARRDAASVEAGESGADDAAAERLLARHAGALGRIADPRVRRQRTYALLARNGFDPETAARAATRLIAPSAAAAEGDPSDL